MKNFIYLFCYIALIISCKEQKKSIPEVEALSIEEKIATAHGYENWKNVSKVYFTFNDKRNWIWQPKTNHITLIKDNDTISYNRNKIDSTLTKTDRAFINDKFWLLIPFQLIWDKGISISTPSKTIAPISKAEINKITLTYSNEGGYTPGDAYDLYYNDEFIIKEWGFRRGNSAEARLINTFENLRDFNGIKIALDHKNDKGDELVKLSNVNIILE
ncbi:hypothetical protein [uncultured Algibacter sp.]|uniref:hypothetical protein n=1 Tax=uncultured Algibacter sp. TaxID=298659 RepID=UPI002602B3AC|nr:hypothetical protein [uncultured Algibacter sp.]